MTEQIQETASDATSTAGSAGSTAMKAAAAAVAAGTAAVMAKKVFSSSGGSSNGERTENGSGNGIESARDEVGSKTTALSSIAAGGLDAARDALAPALEEAAGAAGAFLAENGPEIVRERIVPRFIESFNEARGT